MNQHPVPQNISSYEFRLVGDMTLKQFFQLAGGALVAFILYKTALPGILKWPLMSISALTGVLLAFVPINGRPFSQWLYAFFKAVYSPTRFVWNSQKTVLDFPKDVSSSVASVSATTSTLPLSGSSTLDRFEFQLFTRFSDLFAGKNPFTNTQPSTIKAQDEKVIETVIIDKPILPPPVVTPPNTENLPADATHQALQASRIPNTNINVAPTSLTPIVPHKPIVVSTSPLSSPARIATQSVAGGSPVLSISTPEYPNILTGIVTNSQGASIDSAIIEITDTLTGIPVRALRTNKLGQFQIATPLGNGKFQISTEKGGLSFENFVIETTGKIINPIQITATT